MGGIADGMKKSMGESMDKQQASMRAMNIEMAMKQRQAQISTQLAMGKERFKYYSFVVGCAYMVLPIVAFKTGNP